MHRKPQRPCASCSGTVSSQGVLAWRSRRCPGGRPLAPLHAPSAVKRPAQGCLQGAALLVLYGDHYAVVQLRSRHGSAPPAHLDSGGLSAAAAIPRTHVARPADAPPAASDRGAEEGGGGGCLISAEELLCAPHGTHRQPEGIGWLTGQGWA